MVCMEENAGQLEYVRRETGKGGMGFVPLLGTRLEMRITTILPNKLQGSMDSTTSS